MTQTLAPVKPTTPTTDAAPLTALDRCDRCGAQAYVRSAHRAGDLLWCAHHARMHGDALKPFVVHDETHRLHDVNRAYKSGE